MKISYMREFIEVAKTRSLAKTADQLFFSQPTLSRHIISIETELGVKLFERSSYGVALTPGGKTVLADFMRIVSQYDSLISNLESSKAGISGEIVVGAAYYAIDKFVVPVLEKFAGNYPHIQVKTISNQPDMLFGDLLDEKIDVVFFFCDPKEMMQDYKGIFLQSFATDPLVIFYSDANHLRHKRINLTDLPKSDFIFYECGAISRQTNKYVQAILQNAKIEMGEIRTIDNIDFLSKAICDFNAIAILPKHIADHHPRLHYAEFIEDHVSCMCALSLADNTNPATPLLMNEVFNLSHRK